MHYTINSSKSQGRLLAQSATILLQQEKLRTAQSAKNLLQEEIYHERLASKLHQPPERTKKLTSAGIAKNLPRRRGRRIRE
jgi:hypothetical protein